MNFKLNDIATMEATTSNNFNHIPNKFQQQIVPHALMTMKQLIASQPILLIQSDVSGESAVSQTCRYSMVGIAIVVERTLYLSADKTSKVANLKSNNMLVFQLYQMKLTAE